MAASRAESDQCLKDKLDGLILKWIDTAHTLNIQLFSVDTAITDATVLGDLTFATFSGSAAEELDPSVFGAAAVTSHIASITYGAAFSWTNGDGSPRDVYGYAVWDDDDSEFLFGENFGTVQTLAPGGTLSVIPVIKDRSADF